MAGIAAIVRISTLLNKMKNLIGGSMSMFKKEDKSTAEDKIIDIETGMQGNMKFNGPINLRISGSFEGELETKGTLIIGENATVKAGIRGENINIQGKVKGDIICNRLELSPTAKLIGNVETLSLVIGEGAILKGKCQMPTGDEKLEDKEALKKKEKKQPEEAKKEDA